MPCSLDTYRRGFERLAVTTRHQRRSDGVARRRQSQRRPRRLMPVRSDQAAGRLLGGALGEPPLLGDDREALAAEQAFNLVENKFAWIVSSLQQLACWRQGCVPQPCSISETAHRRRFTATCLTIPNDYRASHRLEHTVRKG